jgi:sugar lactone lactonase YvrE
MPARWTKLRKTRLNDGRVDPAGRFVRGGMDEGAHCRRCTRFIGTTSRVAS